MNVCVIDYGFIPGVSDPDALLDAFPSLTAWCESLLANGASRVTVAQRFGRAAQVVRNGVEYEFRSSVPALHGAARAAKAELAHVNGFHFPLQLWRLRAAIPGIAMVVQDHGGGDSTRHPAPRGFSVRRTIWRRGLGAANAFLFTAVAQSDSWKAAGLIRPDQRVFGVLESSTSIKALGYREARMASGLRGEPSVLWVGRLNRNKDPLAVLSGFERAATDAPKAHLTMIFSTDELIGAVRERIACSEVLRDRVTLAGSVPHGSMAAYFSAADVFTLGSHHEGSGFALLEACACGSVPAVSDIPSFRAIADDVGRFWPAGDVESCGRQLAAAWQASTEPGARARVVRHFESKLSWPVVGASAMAAYASVLDSVRLSRR